MPTKAEIRKLAQQALSCGELAEYLSGENGYACGMDPSVPANVPTDFERILAFGLYPLYSESSRPEAVSAAFSAALEKLLSGSAVQVWIAYMVSLFQYRLEEQGYSPFVAMSPYYMAKVKAALYEHETELRTVKEWQGKGREQGLWQNIVATNDVLKRNSGVTFL